MGSGGVGERRRGLRVRKKRGKGEKKRRKNAGGSSASSRT